MPEIVITPLLSTPENPTNDRVDGVVEAPPSIDTFKGAGAATLSVVFALEVAVVNPLSCSTATSGKLTPSNETTAICFVLVMMSLANEIPDPAV